MTARDDLARYLLACRKQASHTQETAGAALGVDPSQISRWESRTNRQIPRATRARQLAEVYGVDPTEMSLMISAAHEEEAAEGQQALASVATIAARLDALEGAIAEVLRRLPAKPA